MTNTLEYLSILDNEVVEVRIFCKEYKIPINGKDEYVQGTSAGYYDRDCIDKLIEDIKPYDGKADAIYTTIHDCKKAISARINNRIRLIRANENVLTKDTDVTAFSVFPVDVDSVRPSGVSATTEERELAAAFAKKVYDFFVG